MLVAISEVLETPVGTLLGETVVEEYDLFARTCAAALFEIALYLVAWDGADRHQPLLVALADDADVALPEKEVGKP